MQVRNLAYNAFGTIDCEVEHPQWGWIPFTASPDDVEEFGRAVHAGIIDSGAEIAAYVAPPEPTAAELLAAERARMRLTFAQLLIGLVAQGWITEAEGEAWLSGTLPQPVLDLIATLPAEQRFAARARAVRPSVVLRLDPLVLGLATSQGKTEAELDAFFTGYAQA